MLRIVALLSLIALIGCVPKTLMPEKIAEIKTMGVITSIPDDNLKVLDHRFGTFNKTYTYGQFGALGALMESLILIGIREYNTGSISIDGNVNEVRLSNVNLRLKHEIDSDLTQKLSKKYDIVGPQYFDARELSLRKKSECLVESKKIGIDTLVFLDIAYGLASYDDKQASVSIDAELIVYDVNKEEILLKKVIESDQEFREHRTIEDFTKENGKLLKEDLNAAINGFSSYVSRQLGIWQ